MYEKKKIILLMFDSLLSSSEGQFMLCNASVYHTSV